MNKRKIIIILGMVGIFSISILAGYEMDNIKEYTQSGKDDVSYSDYSETSNTYGSIKDKYTNNINVKDINSYWYILEVKNEDNKNDFIMVKLTVPEDKYDNGDKVYYYKDVFKDGYDVYSATYTNDGFLLRNTGPNIVSVYKLSDYIDNEKEYYSMEELNELLNDIKENKKGLSKTYKSFN